MFFAHPMTVTVNHRAIDRNGDYTITSTHQEPNCAISFTGKASGGRGGAQESFERDTMRAATVLFAPADADIQIDDTVITPDGITWHVWGIPTTFFSPFTGWQPGMQVPLRAYMG